MKAKQIIISIAALASLFAFSSYAEAQDTKDKVSITNVDVSRAGTILFISYDLSLGPRVQSCETELMVSLDGGKTFSAVASNPGLTGDLGKITANGKKEIRYDISSVKKQYAGKDIVFEVRSKHLVVVKPKAFIMAGICAYPVASSFNFMGGYADKFGGYARVRSNFNSAKADASYTCKSSGQIDGGGTIWATGNSQSSMFTATAGALFRVKTWFYPYVGIGYGTRTILWEDSEHKMVTVSDLSYKGVVAEAGMIFNIGFISLSLGASNLASVNGFGIDAGIGINF